MEPLNPPANPTDPLNEQREGEPRLPPLKILVVDDASTNRKLITRMLERAGAVAHTAENGEQACELCERQEFDLILMDMQMPVLDGYAATRRLRDGGYELPIIALTARASKGDAEKCLQAGCSRHLTKPVETHRLLTAIGRAMGLNVREAPNSGRSASDASRVLRSTLPLEDKEFRDAVEEFAQRLPKKVAEMQLALEQHDGARLAQLAHWLKGAGGTAGFASLTDPARLLEQYAKAGEVTGAQSVLRKIQSLQSRIVVEPEDLATAAT